MAGRRRGQRGRAAAPADSLSRRALDGLVLADIATAQELTGRTGRLDRIDLILPEDEGAAARSRALLPPDAQIVPVAARTGALAQMTAAFRINLTALSLLALVVGMFLIYNSMTFSVVQRRPLFGTLRCLGVTPAEIGLLVLGEALDGRRRSVPRWGWPGAHAGPGRRAAGHPDDQRPLLRGHRARRSCIPVAEPGQGRCWASLATVLSAALPAWEAASVPPR